MSALLKEAPDFSLDEANASLAEKTAEAIIAWAAATFGKVRSRVGASPSGLVMTSSFGATSAVMLHLMSEHAPGTPVIWIDTGHLFAETYRFGHQLQERLNLDLRIYRPAMTAAHQSALYGDLWDQGEEGIKEYLRINKVEPMQEALTEINPAAWLAGLRSGQTEHRRNLDTVAVQDGRYKVHPILAWSRDDVEAYLAKHNLPHHPLVKDNYHSIGDVHSTLPTLPGQDPREGRVLGKTQECGIHLPLTEEENRSLTSSKL